MLMAAREVLAIVPSPLAGEMARRVGKIVWCALNAWARRAHDFAHASRVDTRAHSPSKTGVNALMAHPTLLHRVRDTEPS